jgi:cell division septation protein DedD
MSYLHDEIDDGPQHRSAYNQPSRELTLSTPAILGIFFGLALLCAVFFGFGYNMGSKSHQAPILAGNTTTAPAATNFDNFKPAPGAPAVQTAPPVISAPAPVTDTPADTSAATPSQPAPIVRSTPSTPAPTAPTHTEASATPASETGLTFIVQIAAVSHQEDADLLVAALKRKGYSVASRTEPQDKLIHIQVGPFPTKKDAEAMRQRLLGDGYNAILK